MASTSESTFGQRYTKGIELLAILTNMGTNYAPNNGEIKVANLTTYLASINTANSVLADKKQKLVDKRSVRNEGFHGEEGLKVKLGMIRDFVGSLKGGKDSPAYKAIQVETQKASNYRKSRASASVPSDTPETIKRKVSNAETSFGSLLLSGRNVVEIIKNIPNYAPQNNEIKVSSIKTYLDSLDTMNAEVASSLNNFDIAVNERNILYKGEGGLLKRVAMVKNFIAATFGKKSQEYKSVMTIKL